MSLELYRELRDLALAAASLGGEFAEAHFRRPDLQVEHKQDYSPVTVADRGAEAAIRACIQRARPEDALLGEEEGACSGRSGIGWIIDPIDGTRNFVRGIPLWSVLIAAEQDNRVIAAVVAFPALDETYDAVLGDGARCNGASIRVSEVSRLDQALFCYETQGWFRCTGLTGLFDELCQDTGLQRGLGDAYGHMLVASGRAELMVEPQIQVWDIAAVSLVVREAGGAFSDLEGRDSIRSGHALASNGVLHAELLARIAAHRADRA